MTAAPPNAWTSFWRTVIRFESGKTLPWLAMRNTLGVALPLAAGVAFGNVAVGLVTATGALNVCFSDSHDPYAYRARKMLAACVLVGVAVFLGALCGHSHPITVAVAGAWAFAAGIQVAVGATAADLGVVSLVTLIVFAASPQPIERAVYSGLLAIAGGLLQTGFALAMWVVRRYVPERRALSSLYRELARMASSPGPASQAPPASAQSTEAQNHLANLNRDHSVEGERHRLLLSQAERIRLGLLTLGRLRARIERESPGCVEVGLLNRYCEACSRVLTSIADSLAAGTASQTSPDDLENLVRLPDDLRRLNWERPPLVAAMARDARFQMDALAGQIRTSLDLAAATTPEGLAAFERKEAARPSRLRLGGTLAILRANLSLDSAGCRHAVRLAVCVALGEAMARGLGLLRPYWLPMTIAIVLKPDFTATFSRGVLRLLGTFAGLSIATGLFHVLPQSPGTEVVLIAVFMFVLRCFGSANYGLLVTAVTALVVLLVALSGVPPNEVMAARALNTALGGAVALLAYYLWPTWERTQISEALAQMLDAYRDYFRVIRESYEHPDESFPDRLDHVRLAGRLSRSNVEASIDRLTAEPGTQARTISALSGILASSHRLVHALMALEAGLSTSGPARPREAFRRFANDVELTLYYLAAAFRGSELQRDWMPDLREDHHALLHSGDPAAERYALVNVETDRITNSLNTLTEDFIAWKNR